MPTLEESLKPTPAEVFAATRDAVEALREAPAEEFEAAIENGIATILDTLPRVSLEQLLTVNLPSDIVRSQLGEGVAEVDFFMFSPAFEPEYVREELPTWYDPENPDPYTLARRNGGAGIEGNLSIGIVRPSLKCSAICLK